MCTCRVLPISDTTCVAQFNEKHDNATTVHACATPSMHDHSCNTTGMLDLMRDLQTKSNQYAKLFCRAYMHRPGGADSGKFCVSRMNKRWPAHQNRFA